MPKESFDCLLINPKSSTQNLSTQTKLITLNPLNIIIEHGTGETVKTMEIKNVYPCRVAYRILCNGPTRYVIFPNKGFIGIAEKITIKITLLDTLKYQSNHAFIVQAMPAPGDFADRKAVWMNPQQYNILGIMTNTRVRTMRPAVQPLNIASSTTTSISSSAASSTSDVHTAPSNPNDSSAKSSPQKSEAIEELTAKVRKSAEEKSNLTNEMVKVVNEIKSIEVDLDRQTQLVNELNDRIKNGEGQYTNLVLRENILKEELEIARQRMRMLNRKQQ